jgi:hypothetical protein
MPMAKVLPVVDDGVGGAFVVGQRPADDVDLAWALTLKSF